MALLQKPGFLVRLGHIFDWQLARWRSFRPSMKNAVVVLLCSTPRSRCPTVPKFFFFAETSIFWCRRMARRKSHKKMLKLVKFVFLSCQWRQQSSCYASPPPFQNDFLYVAFTLQLMIGYWHNFLLQSQGLLTGISRMWYIVDTKIDSYCYVSLHTLLPFYYQIVVLLCWLLLSP